jgi:Mor family transcriptional regulator
MDILNDIAERLVAGGACHDLTARVLADVRRDWGGEETYICKNAESPTRVVTRRNAALLRDWRLGERVPLLARKYQISTKRVYAILKLSRASP